MPTAILIDGAFFVKRFRALEPDNAFDAERAADFVPAAKLARREGVDFILDPMWQPVSATLQEHVDGLRSTAKRRARDESAPEASSGTLSDAPLLPKAA